MMTRGLDLDLVVTLAPQCRKKRWVTKKNNIYLLQSLGHYSFLLDLVCNIRSIILYPSTVLQHLPPFFFFSLDIKLDKIIFMSFLRNKNIILFKDV